VDDVGSSCSDSARERTITGGLEVSEVGTAEVGAGSSVPSEGSGRNAEVVAGSSVPPEGSGRLSLVEMPPAKVGEENFSSSLENSRLGKKETLSLQIYANRSRVWVRPMGWKAQRLGPNISRSTRGAVARGRPSKPMQE
jgi:hypothetical protein